MRNCSSPTVYSVTCAGRATVAVPEYTGPSQALRTTTVTIRPTGNPPVVVGRPLFEQLGVTPEGLVFLNSLSVPGFAVPDGGGSGKVPYAQNWNLTLSFGPFRNTVVEFAYVGAKGTHLYMPLVNINNVDVDFIETLEGRGINSDDVFNDPLDRQNLAGGVVRVPAQQRELPIPRLRQPLPVLRPVGQQHPARRLRGRAPPRLARADLHGRLHLRQVHLPPPLRAPPGLA